MSKNYTQTEPHSPSWYAWMAARPPAIKDCPCCGTQPIFWYSFPRGENEIRWSYRHDCNDLSGFASGTNFKRKREAIEDWNSFVDTIGGQT